MKLLIFLIFSTISTNLYAEKRIISIDELSCGTNNYENVSVSFDANEVMADKISKHQVCGLLDQKFRRLHHRESSRIYPGDEQASLVNSHIKRANDFLDIFLFKPTLLGKKKFTNWDGDFTELVMKVRETTNAKVFIYKKDKINFEVYPELKTAYGFYLNGVLLIEEEHAMGKATCEIINTLVHEYIHHAGFNHRVGRSRTRALSVPYSIGDRAQVLCEAGVI